MQGSLRSGPVRADSKQDGLCELPAGGLSEHKGVFSIKRRAGCGCGLLHEVLQQGFLPFKWYGGSCSIRILSWGKKKEMGGCCWWSGRRSLLTDVFGYCCFFLVQKAKKACRKFDRDLKFATKNFSKENKLGEGGFGEVFKGTLKNGKIIAVKKLVMTQTKSARASFLSEVKLISNVHHQNLLRLLGCSSKRSELLLVYEYMSNGSLDKFLFGEMHGMLNWKQRFDIVVGMARGLAYLHHEFHVCIIHRDIKSNNVLLDDNFKPKIADFGLARLLPGDQSHLSTYFAGTLGYIAPEYVIHGDLTEKVDTYSFGVVVLEIISGQRSSGGSVHEALPQHLLEWAWQLNEEDRLLKLIDKSLNPDEYDLEEVERVITIALLCTQVVSLRPTMSEVLVMLLSRGRLNVQLSRPTFIESPSRVAVI
ncbi:hypothetical protein HPP92_022210 [Vanilla planifolia]|uniref:Protein kinase domain-containing protein n=1 Tax=Vanilla planifolia TaxID=51239 RepID=A0A835UEW5_VANPL|nr:hypothetical protein HPP92_022210 [Vanilla planifolia]